MALGKPDSRSRLRRSSLQQQRLKSNKTNEDGNGLDANNTKIYCIFCSNWVVERCHASPVHPQIRSSRILFKVTQLPESTGWRSYFTDQLVVQEEAWQML